MHPRSPAGVAWFMYRIKETKFDILAIERLDDLNLALVANSQCLRACEAGLLPPP